MTVTTGTARGPGRRDAESHSSTEANVRVAEALNFLLADLFTLFVKTKNFHWHVTGPHFRDYHLLFDEQATQILGTTDVVAERVRKLRAGTLRSVGHIARLQRLDDNDDADVGPQAMLEELMDDNQALARSLHESHAVCEAVGDVATASLIEVWIDEADRRTWFLHEASQAA